MRAPIFVPRNKWVLTSGLAQRRQLFWVNFFCGGQRAVCIPMNTCSGQQWWDRDIDERSGRPIRADVREAAHKAWQHARVQTWRVLGDDSEAAEALETAVGTVSRYLDRRHVLLHSVNPSGLLVLNAYRFVRRLARKRSRIESAGGTSDLATLLRTPAFEDETARRLFLEQLARELSRRNRAILQLRLSDYEWPEIARMMQTTVGTIRSGFWRDVRRAHLKLQAPPVKTRPLRQSEG